HVGVAVDERDALTAVVRLVLGPFRPVEADADQEELAGREVPDRPPGVLLRPPPLLVAHALLRLPAPARDGRRFRAGALAFRLRQVAHPQRHRTLRAAQLDLDPVVRPALQAQLPCPGPQIVLRAGAPG